MIPDIVRRKRTHFVLWRPGVTSNPPKLVIGTSTSGPNPRFTNQQKFVLRPVEGIPDLYELPAGECGLKEGGIYHYWFEVVDTNAYVGQHNVVWITDPAAYSVDWKLTYVLPSPYHPDEADVPASVIRWSGGELRASDADRGVESWAERPDVSMNGLPRNNQLVIYELPTAWTKLGDLVNATNVGVGTFKDVRAMMEEPDGHLRKLGINALELLPPADTFADRRSWGYATSNYFAPDWDLGAIGEDGKSRAVGEFLSLMRACHQNGIRFFYDAVMAFSKFDSYRFVNFSDYHVAWGQGDPEQGGRDGFGGDLWKYSYMPDGYDPVTGGVGQLHPARRQMISHLLYWMDQYHLDGLRLDSVVNYRSWDFIGEIRDTARQAWAERWAKEGNPGNGSDRFLVVAEELAVPVELLGKVDALWNERFKQIIRKVILGQSEGDWTFEDSVKRMIDPRGLGFGDGSQSVNYLGSHDVGGMGNERFCTYLGNCGVVKRAERIRLAFVCLLTSVGIPMILAGDEFADEHDFPQVTDANKQIDAVNFDRKDEPWRREVLEYVSRLVRFRIGSAALGVNDTEFIHVDFEEGKRVLVWKRGNGEQSPVVVVANFSDWGSEVGEEYRVPNWPALPPGKRWVEVGMGREVPADWAGRESLYPWDAKVYAAV